MAAPPSLKEFGKAFGLHWLEAMSGRFAVPFGFLGALLAGALYWSGHDVYATPIAVGTALVLAVAASGAAAFMAWKDERQKVVHLDKGDLLEAGRLALARLRQSGVAMRNAGQFGFEEEGVMRAWMDKLEAWNAEVVFSIMAVNAADAEWFRIADVVEPPRIPMKTAHDMPSLVGDERLMLLYAIHDFRLVKLEKLILAYGKL